jgi:hypothetical protein
MGQRTCNDHILKFVVFCERMIFYQQQLFRQFSTDVGHTCMLNVSSMDCKLMGYTAESGVSICHLPIRVALQSWSGVIRVITCTNGIHVFCTPYSSRFLPLETCQKSPLCVRATMNGVFFLAPRCYNLPTYPPLFLGATMVSHVLNYVREYGERLQGMPLVPRFSYGCLLRCTSPCNSDHLLVPMLI